MKFGEIFIVLCNSTFQSFVTLVFNSFESESELVACFELVRLNALFMMRYTKREVIAISWIQKFVNIYQETILLTNI